MSLDLGAIRAAIAAAAGTVTPPDGVLSLTGYARIPGRPELPCAYPAETDGNYKEAAGGVAGVVVTLRILTSRAEDESAQQALDAFLSYGSPASVATAIETAMPEASVTGFSGYRPYEIAENSYYGAELTVVVLA